MLKNKKAKKIIFEVDAIMPHFIYLDTFLSQ